MIIKSANDLINVLKNSKVTCNFCQKGFVYGALEEIKTPNPLHTPTDATREAVPSSAPPQCPTDKTGCSES